MGSKDMEKLAELVDASLKFTRVLKKKGVSQATLQVAVRCRPLTPTERSLGSRPITRLVDNKIVVVMDPQPNHANHNVYGKGKSSAAQKREKKYVFDAAFDGSCDNREIYGKTVGNLVPGVLKGLNATVFAYGATGSGKTYTMVGSNMDPGLMVLSLRDIFEHIDRDTEKQIDVTCSYLEVYNEIIYDLLQPTAAQRGLDLREDPENGPQVAGLRRLKVQSAEKIFQLLREGNLRRRTESTDANAESSRSHAVLEIVVRRSDKNHYAKNVYTGKLALVDLAGAERAHETNNHGQQLRDGANINRSLLALANCINALGKRKKKGFVFVPFRNSKLTRLLKDGLCGNSRTIMIATCASADTQYNHTVNTLKYADRAKEIKTHVRMDKKTVDTHIAEYQRMIDALQDENRDLKMAVHAMTGTKWQGLQNIPKFDKLSKPAIEATSPQAKTPQPKKAAKVEKDQRSEQKAAWMRRTSESMKTLSTNRAKCQQELLEAHQRKIRHQIDAEMISEQIQAKLKSDETHDIQMLHQRKSDAAISLSDSNSSVAHLENTMSSYDAQLAILEAEIESSSASSERDALRLQAVAGRRETENVFSKIDARARNAIIMEQNSVINCLWQILERHGVNKDMATETAWNAKIFPHSGSSQDSKTFFQQYKSVNNSEQKEVLKKALTGYKNDLETKQWADLSSITASTTEKASKATARMAEAAVLVQATKNDPNPNPASRAARTNTLRSSETASNTKKLSEKLSEKSETPPPKVIQAFGSPSSKENSNPAKVKGKKKLEGKKGKDVSQIGNLKLAMRKRRQSISDR